MFVTITGSIVISEFTTATYVRTAPGVAVVEVKFGLTVYWAEL